MRHLTSLTICVLVLTACSAGANALTTAPPTPSTSDPITTVAEATTTSTVVPVTVPDGGVDEPAEGSGCSPGGDALPNGLWFGYPTELHSAILDFDLACWFTGDAAVQAAAQDGDEVPAHDHYVRNLSATIRSVTVASSAVVTWYPSVGDPTSKEVVPYSEWVDGVGARGLALGVWITMVDGSIAEVREQWVP